MALGMRGTLASFLPRYGCCSLNRRRGRDPAPTPRRDRTWNPSVPVLPEMDALVARGLSEVHVNADDAATCTRALALRWRYQPMSDHERTAWKRYLGKRTMTRPT